MNMIKKMLIICALVLLLCGCGQHMPNEPINTVQPMTWQEQYDLGMRYLTEGNYTEAIIAFTAAIEIDPKQVEAYIGRGDAYVGSGDTSKDSAAEEDYLYAIELDASNPLPYGKLADLYLRQGEDEKAIAILEKGLSATSDESLKARLDNLKSENGDEFEHKPDFVRMSDIPEQYQQKLNMLIDATIEGNMTALHEFAGKTDESDFFDCLGQRVKISSSNYPWTGNEEYGICNTGYAIRLYTINGYYKVMLYWRRISADDSYYTLCVIVRQREGMGYCSIVEQSGLSAGEGSTGTRRSTIRATCPCVDWQWEGTKNETYDGQDYIVLLDGSTIQDKTHNEEVGNITHNLYDGTFVETARSERTDSNGTTDWNGEPTIFVYSEGKLVEAYGVQVNDDRIYGDIITNYKVWPGSAESWYW